MCVWRSYGSRMPDSTRLTVNINAETRAALGDITARRGITWTEAVRRAVAVYKLFEDETAAGNTIRIAGGGDAREVVLL